MLIVDFVGVVRGFRGLIETVLPETVFGLFPILVVKDRLLESAPLRAQCDEPMSGLFRHSLR